MTARTYIRYLVRSRPGLAVVVVLLVTMTVSGAVVLATGTWAERLLVTAMLALSLRDFRYAALELRALRRAAR